MRKLQNINCTISNTVVRLGNLLIVRVEALRALHAKFYSALSSSTLECVLGLFRVWQLLGWQRLCLSSQKPQTIAACCFTAPTTGVAKRPTRSHMIMCLRTAA